MKTRRKHDATDEAMRLSSTVAQWEERVSSALRTYKQDDLLADICSAREAAVRLRDMSTALAVQVASLADAELAARALYVQRSGGNGGAR